MTSQYRTASLNCQLEIFSPGRNRFRKNGNQFSGVDVRLLTLNLFQPFSIEQLGIVKGVIIRIKVSPALFKRSASSHYNACRSDIDQLFHDSLTARSEERRVGKECRLLGALQDE